MIDDFLETTRGTSPDIQGAYTILKRCYHHSSARQQNPPWSDLEKVSRDYAAIYYQEDPSPLGKPFLTHIDPFQINDGFPTEAEVKVAVCQLRSNSTGGPTHLQAKHLYTWLKKVCPEKEANPSLPNQKNG